MVPVSQRRGKFVLAVPPKFPGKLPSVRIGVPKYRHGRVKRGPAYIKNIGVSEDEGDSVLDQKGRRCKSA